MSIRLTQNNIPMVESRSLQLVLNSVNVHEAVSLYLSASLKQLGYIHASPSVLNFLSTLECGVNYGSEIARSLGVSRQMVAKTVKELCCADYLEQRDGPGKQKEILFTKTGELLMSEARKLLADVDKLLVQEIGYSQLQSTIDNLDRIQALVSGLNNLEK